MQKSISSINVSLGGSSTGIEHKNTNITKSQSMYNCEIEKGRGFKPSDRHDPAKRDFLTDLSKQIWHNHEEPSSTIAKKIDLQKIFTPATDTEEILPKNRKLYASSVFYCPNHPTVEDQVELARRISHSLSDISNHQSKGQSMFVNRKKRSVKWVTEGSGKGQPEVQEYNEEIKENEYNSRNNYGEKVPLKLVMNPHGQVRDINSVREPLSETGLLSPDRCAELVTALNASKGRGAELFAKRRRKAEKWIVEETNVSPGLIDPYQQSNKPTSPASMVPAYSDVGIHRVQLNMEQDKIQDKYNQPSLKIIKSPWEAALETGSASTAFEEEQMSSQPDLALKPNMPQGWKPIVILPKGEEGQFLTDNDEDEIINLMSKTKLQSSEQQNTEKQQIHYHLSEEFIDSNDFQGHLTTKIQNDDVMNENENYVKVPVKDLILTFEQQVEAEKIEAENQMILKPVPKKPRVMSLYHEEKEEEKQIILDKAVEEKNQYNKEKDDMNNFDLNSLSENLQNNQELYVPKKIPPAASHNLPKCGFPVKHHSSAFSPISDNGAHSRFPTVKQTTDSFSSLQSEKQQQWMTNLYQQQQQTSSSLSTPVNFNPSPLPYDKLAKFEQPDPLSTTYQSPHPLPMGPTSPSTFDLTKRFPSQDIKGYSLQGLANSSNSGVPSVNLLHCQNFNVSARGWGQATKHEPYRALTVNPRTVGNLRYSDF